MTQLAVMHDWGDEECVKILKRCKETIPKPGGKVIVVEIVKKKWPHQVFKEPQLVLDLLMMVMYNGKERNEEEWKQLFIDSGFSSYKIASKMSKNLGSLLPSTGGGESDA
ncbi:hypothetical protein EJ110_NYTH25451 [Nymphaea thermarum]|nr:hypothetical protein EJ110_NYTH25451 [Nymphaea thermarum]